ncbi:hypothetical protein BKA93DRAFT_706568, partial [Sparassis latifolia]
KYLPTQSALSGQVQPAAVLNKILSTPITILVGKVIGFLREISNYLWEIIKYKRAPVEPDNNMVASTIIMWNWHTLIQFSIDCDGRQIEAIVDTGSVLNIVHSWVWKDKIQ